MHPFHRKHNGNSSLNSRYSSAGKQNGIKRDENGEPSYEFDDKFYYVQREPQMYSEKESSRLTEKENVLKSYLLGKTSPSEGENGREEAPEQTQESPQAVKNPSCVLSSSSKRTLNSNRSTSPSPTKQSLKNFVHLNISNKSHLKTEEVSNSVSVPSISFSEQDSKTFNNCNFLSPNQNVESKPINEAQEVFFIEKGKSEKDSFIPNTTDCKVEPQLSDSFLIKKMLLANNKTISKKWLGESFTFDKSPTSYGLFQSKEGPRGLIAAINAHVIKQLLYEQPKKDVEYLRPNDSELEAALIMAMSEILWKAGGNSATVTILENPLKEFNTIEDIVDNSINKLSTSRNDLQEAIKRNILQYTEANGHGCILFLLSAILSRGVENVLDDMNGVTSLISSNGYSTLELVNLLLTGHAVSNVFDNNIKLKYSIIKGIANRSDIGYLSIKEHFKCCKVGSYLKTPRYPIWLVHNENHFTLLFSCQKQLVSDWKVERKFLLFYYDSLKKPSEEMKLIIDTTLAEERRNDLDDMKISLEHCVRTKWKDANIMWK